MNPKTDPLSSEGGGSLQRMQEMSAHFSRPGSAYVVKVPELNNRKLEVINNCSLRLGQISTNWIGLSALCHDYRLQPLLFINFNLDIIYT